MVNFHQDQTTFR